VLLLIGGVAAAGAARFTPPEAVRELLRSMAATVPAELRNSDTTTFAPAWQAWVTGHDAEIRGRLERGDADTVVNWLLFGTTFTRHPRVALDPLTAGGSTPTALQQLADLIAERTRDFVRALAVPGIRDTQCGFKLFRGDVARELFRRARVDGFAYDMEILYLARRRGIAIAEVPVVWINSPESKVSVVRHALPTLWDLVRLRWLHRRDAP